VVAEKNNKLGDASGNRLWMALDVQIPGSLVVPLWAFVTMFPFFSILKKTGILRVSREDELAGLDLVEHCDIKGD